MSYKLFKSNWGGRTANTPRITMTRKNLSFNRAASEQWLGDKNHCQLFYDKTASRIGVKLLAKKNPESRKVCRAQSGTHMITIETLRNHHGITYDGNCSVRLGKADQNGIQQVIIDKAK